MASIRKTIALNASAGTVWDALKDFGALHTRLVPGFVTDTKLDGDCRIVTFANGSVAREFPVTVDETNRRLVYRAATERLTHHNASAEVIADGADRCRFVWTADLQPDEFAPYIDGQMDLGAAAIKRAFGD